MVLFGGSALALPSAVVRLREFARGGFGVFLHRLLAPFQDNFEGKRRL